MASPPFGPVPNSPAGIIGTILISPLIDSILATGLVLAVGDLYLGVKAVLNPVASVAVSVAFTAVLAWLLPFHSATKNVAPVQTSSISASRSYPGWPASSWSVAVRTPVQPR